MKIKSLGQNQTEVTTDMGVTVLVSYSTPVAAVIPMPGNALAYHQTSEHYSATTTRHINAWLRSHGQNPATVRKVSPSFLAGLV